MATTTIDVKKIKDWQTFHAQSAEAFGFPDFYGKNLNAWIDCLSYLPDGDGMSSIVLGAEEQLTILLPSFEHFAKTQPEICLVLLESFAVVNLRYIAEGQIPRLVLLPQ